MSKRPSGTSTGRRVFAVRVASTTPDKLADMAMQYGFSYLGKNGERYGASGQLMDAIAAGEIQLLKEDQ